MIKFSLYNLQDEDQSNISLSKVSISGIPKAGCDRVAFTEDSSILVAHCEGVLHVLQVDPEAGATPVQVITLDKCKLSYGCISIFHCNKIQLSQNSLYLIKCALSYNHAHYNVYIFFRFKIKVNITSSRFAKESDGRNLFGGRRYTKQRDGLDEKQ